MTFFYADQLRDHNKALCNDAIIEIRKLYELQKLNPVIIQAQLEFIQSQAAQLLQLPTQIQQLQHIRDNGQNDEIG